MLPVPKDSVTSQECVGESQIGEPADGDIAEVAGDSEREQMERAPLLYVCGERWSPGVYRTLRLRGVSLEVAWKRAFVALPTF